MRDGSQFLQVQDFLGNGQDNHLWFFLLVFSDCDAVTSDYAYTLYIFTQLVNYDHSFAFSLILYPCSNADVSKQSTILIYYFDAIIINLILHVV